MLAGSDVYIPGRGWSYCRTACTDADGPRTLGETPRIRGPAWAVLLRRERGRP